MLITPIAKFMGPTWGPSGSCRPQMGPILATWILLSGYLWLVPTWLLSPVQYWSSPQSAFCVCLHSVLAPWYCNINNLNLNSNSNLRYPPLYYQMWGLGNKNGCACCSPWLLWHNNCSNGIVLPLNYVVLMECYPNMFLTSLSCRYRPMC